MNGEMDKDKASEEKADMLGGAAKSPEAGVLSNCPCLLRFIARGRVWRGNLFSCVLLSLAPVAGLLYVDALPEWLHQSACRAEPARHGGSLLIARILLSSLIYLLLRLGAVALKRVPSLRYVVAGGAGVVLLCLMLFPEESGLRMAAGLMAWGASALASYPAEQGRVYRMASVAGFASESHSAGLAVRGSDVPCLHGTNVFFALFN